MGESQHRVILIGGTSHSGKSMLAQFMADEFGWEWRSTDKLARHPGRPWSKSGKQVPEHVVEHYSALSIDELVADVLRHYRENVIPQVEDIVHQRRTDTAARCLVLEGSALWPEFVMNLRLHDVGAIWLVASEELVRSRIYEESGYAEASEEQKPLIQKFLDRSLLYNERMRQAVDGLGLKWIDIASAADLRQLSGSVLKRISADVQGE